ncbi:MAG TPA: hypothetical protein DHW42_11170 [Candidatus Marinimicrobia bacterium]|nr:hypothetical protein [Candidatus Neomarinimicrobiota bacterium]
MKKIFNRTFITQKRKPFFLLANRYLNKESVILDIGAGNGDFAKALERNDIFMVDGNPETVNKYKATYKNYCHSILPDLPFKEKYFDMIHCSHVIEHLYPNELYNLLKEINRCLKNNGLLIISTPTYWRGFYDDLSHVRPYNPTVIIRYLTTNSDTPSRKPISNKYRIVQIVYRYFEVPIENNYFNKHSDAVTQIYYFIKRITYFLGFRKLEKSGYTIILQKE